MRTLIFALSALILVSCSTNNKPTVDGSREPNQYRDDYRRDDRRDGRRDDYGRDDYRRDRRDDRRDGPGYDGPNRDGRRGEWSGPLRNGRRCIRCFDRARWNDVQELGSPVEFMFDQTFGPRESEKRLWNPICGIKSVSVEVQENEAQITGLAVHYVGDSMFTWDNLPIQKNWDFRDGSHQGEDSIWFDVGSRRPNDRVCIDGVRATGFTYKDRFFDYKNAQIQFYGSMTIRGAGARPGPGGGYGPGPGPVGPGGGYGPGPAPVPQPITVIEKAYLQPAFDCINRVPAAQNPDDIYQDKLFSSRGSLRLCDNARDPRPRREYENRGFTCIVDTLAYGRTYPDCVNGLLGKFLPGGVDSKGRPFKLTGSQRSAFTNYCSEQVVNCSKTIYR